MTSYRLIGALLFMAVLTNCSSGVRAQTESAQQVIEIQRSYVDGPFGQLHVREMRPAEAETSHPPLILLHPTPFSGAFFEPFMRRMASDRLVVAIDTPGYGSSDRPPQPASIEALANAIVTGLDELDLSDTKFDVLGYHTGGLIAAELSLHSRANVRRLVLPGLPYYVGAKREKAYQEYARPYIIKSDGSHLASKWDFAALAVEDGLSIEQAQASFSDMMQAAPHDWWAYHGVFSYPSERRLPMVHQPVLLIATSGSLTAETQAALKVFPNPTLKTLPEVKHGLFALHLDTIEAATREFLDVPVEADKQVGETG